ncbi:MAG: hypothetical protein AzoDbin1_05454, partial [Azoarcus sp.]|nr:hypothetical protein [Azoarcus sp.]
MTLPSPLPAEGAGADASPAAIERAIRDALAAIRPGSGGLAGDGDLMQEADLDSIGVMDLVMEIED